MEDSKIMSQDVMFRSELVSILKPSINKGIILFHSYTQPPNSEPLSKTGLKTGRQLKSEGIDFGRVHAHPYIFFRAPICVPRNNLNTLTIEEQIGQLYDNAMLNMENMIYIRVDPDNTYIFSSEIRAKAKDINIENDLVKSKKTLSEYLKIMENNQKINVLPDTQAIYNIFTHRKYLVPARATPHYPYDYGFSSEILVDVPHLTPNHFVYFH